MSAYRCECCGTDAPLSEPCPICEPLVTRALAGNYDLKPAYMPLPHEETRALMARIEAMRVDRAVLVEQLAQKNREIQQVRSDLAAMDAGYQAARLRESRLREALALRANGEVD